MNLLVCMVLHKRLFGLQMLNIEPVLEKCQICKSWTCEGKSKFEACEQPIRMLVSTANHLAKLEEN